MNFDVAFERLIGHEGGYVNDARDPGLRSKGAGNLFKRCAALKPKLDCVPAAPPLFRPFSQRAIGSVHSKASGCSQVVRLLFRGSPSAVPRLIPSVIVDSVNRHSGRALAHCGKKFREVIAPLVAYRDAAPSPQIETWVVRVVAPVFHVGPHTIGARFAQSVRPQGFGGFLFLEAAA